MWKVAFEISDNLIQASSSYAGPSVQSCFVRRALSLLSLASPVHSSPGHRFKHRNFIFGIHMRVCPQYMHMKF